MFVCVFVCVCVRACVCYASEWKCETQRERKGKSEKELVLCPRFGGCGRAVYAFLWCHPRGHWGNSKRFLNLRTCAGNDGFQNTPRLIDRLLVPRWFSRGTAGLFLMSVPDKKSHWHQAGLRDKHNYSALPCSWLVCVTQGIIKVLIQCHHTFLAEWEIFHYLLRFLSWLHVSALACCWNIVHCRLKTTLKPACCHHSKCRDLSVFASNSF